LLTWFSSCRLFPMHFDESSMFAGKKLEAKILKVRGGGGGTRGIRSRGRRSIRRRRRRVGRRRRRIKEEGDKEQGEEDKEQEEFSVFLSVCS